MCSGRSWHCHSTWSDTWNQITKIIMAPCVFICCSVAIIIAPDKLRGGSRLFRYFLFFPLKHTRQAHDVNITSPQRRCNVMTLHRHWGDVIFTSCARWVRCGYLLETPQALLMSITTYAGLGGSVGCAVRLETRRSRVQPPPRSATFFRGDWSWNIFYGHSLPSADSRRAVVSFWRKNVHNTG